MSSRPSSGLDPALWKSLPASLRRQLETLDRRLLPSQLDALIVDLCAHQPLGLHQLAGMLNRSAVYLQNTTLKRLLARKKLQFQHPGRPTHPRQAYRASEKPGPSVVSPPEKRLPQPAFQPVMLSIGVND